MNQHTTVNAPENNHSNELLREFQSRVGSLNYLVQHSRPDLSNCVRELAKFMKSVGLKEMKLLLQAVNYLKNTKDYGLKFIKWNDVNEVDLNCYVDSDYAGDKSTRKSVSGWIVFCLGSPIMWKSKQQPIIETSSTEAEYIALSELTKELMFLIKIFEFINTIVNTYILSYHQRQLFHSNLSSSNTLQIPNAPLTHINVRNRLVSIDKRSGTL